MNKMIEIQQTTSNDPKKKHDDRITEFNQQTHRRNLTKLYLKPKPKNIEMKIN